jgi:hypothetical protein
MDIFEQVNKVIKNMETREKKDRVGNLVIEALVLEEMSQQYRKSIEQSKWDEARDYIQNISKLVIAILSE